METSENTPLGIRDTKIGYPSQSRKFLLRPRVSFRFGMSGEKYSIFAICILGCGTQS